MDIVCPAPPVPGYQVPLHSQFPHLRNGGRNSLSVMTARDPAEELVQLTRARHPEIWDCAADRGRACGGALRCPHPADASRAHLVHTRGWGQGGRRGGGAGLGSRGLIGWWLVGDAARGRALGSGLSFTSWPQVQLGTQPVKLPAGAPPLCPVRQRSPTPGPVPAAPLGLAPLP